MSTELNHVVEYMSQVSIPQEYLNKIDMKNILKGFSDDYKKLDDLKSARARHEDRNFVSRWWNNNELEDAQLDAAELQASFSKNLANSWLFLLLSRNSSINNKVICLSNSIPLKSKLSSWRRMMSI
ncbi:hypothetical protein [Aeromonas hydrophila]|uniref:hypothetical protein n=1 Tax=Aeromonas hydrophila TaxID=644 RepID=UPI000F531A54|nr:hypothetical protein [Aeromonas hydrophila]RQM68634.1 hypothetical protein EHZ82_12735 [Aeromonas hydrophila]